MKRLDKNKKIINMEGAAKYAPAVPQLTEKILINKKIFKTEKLSNNPNSKPIDKKIIIEVPKEELKKDKVFDDYEKTKPPVENSSLSMKTTEKPLKLGWKLLRGLLSRLKRTKHECSDNTKDLSISSFSDQNANNLQSITENRDFSSGQEVTDKYIVEMGAAELKESTGGTREAGKIKKFPVSHEQANVNLIRVRSQVVVKPKRRAAVFSSLPPLRKNRKPRSEEIKKEQKKICRCLQ